MRRNLLKAGFLTLISTVALSSAITAATTDGWQKQGQTPRVKTHVKQVLTPQTQYKRSRGLVNPDAQLRPLGDGIQSAPIAQRPTTGNKVHRTFENPRGHIYAVVPRYSGMEFTYEAFMGKVDLTAGSLTPLYYNSAFCPFVGSDFTFQTDVYRKGHIYCPTQHLDMVEGTSSYVWQLVDIETGNVTAEVNFGSELYGAPYSLTYDENNDLFYGVCLGNGDGTSSHLCVYDPALFKYDGTNCNSESLNPAIFYAGNISTNGNYISAIVYNPLDGKLYGFDQYNTVYHIELTKTKEGVYKTEVFDEQYLDYDVVLFEEGVTTPMVYSPMDQLFITNYPDNSVKQNVTLFIDPLTWEVKEGKHIVSSLNPYIAALICTDEFAEADAPELAPAPSINFEKNNLTGTITFSAPEYTYYGVAIGNTPMDVTLKIDDKVIFEGKMNAKEIKTVDATLTEGLHTLSLVCAIDGMQSPERTKIFYTGNDTPLAPTNLKLTGDMLTWTAPGNVGVNGGYVDTDLFEYDVYIDNAQQNIAPVEDTEFKLRLNRKLNRCKIEVVASVNGKSSQRASINEVIGNALNLPASFAPTKDQFNLFTVINSNGDNQAWYQSNINEGDLSYPAAVFTIGYFVDADDWIVLPPLNFTDGNALYNFAFELASPGANDTSEESFEIYIGKQSNAESLLEGTCIYKRDLYAKGTESLWDDHSYNFAIQEPGTYYIGLHCYSSKERKSAGMYLRNFSVKAVEGQTTMAPGDSDNVTITPSDFGDQSAQLHITIPSKDMGGNPLDPDKEVTYKVYCEQTGDKAEGAGKPGDVINVICDANGMDGFADFCYTPSNEYGSGYTRVARVYVGIDKPLPPVNIQGEPFDNNLGIKITWEAPGNVGVNGGYVNVNGLSYNIYTRSGISYYKIGNTSDLYTNFELGAGSTKLDDYYVGPVSVNSAGESVGSMFVQEQLGVPYESPVKEFWNSTGFTMNPYTYTMTGPFQQSQWENTSVPQAFGEKFANAQCQQGALFSYSMGGHTETQLNLPKISTLNLPRGVFSLRYWDYSDTPELRILARRPGQLTSKLVHTFIPHNPARGTWNEESFTLPEDLLNCSWVQFSIQASLVGGEDEYLVLDTWAVYPDCDYDLSVTSFTGSSQAAFGDKLNYNCLVTSSGTERVSGTLTVDLVDENGKVYATDMSQISNLPSLNVFERNVSFEITGEFKDVNKLYARATVTSDDDELPENNVRQIEVTIKSAQIPAVSDLKGNRTDKGVNLTWTQPTCTYGDYDNFEYYPAFENVDKIGEWQNIDQDQKTPAEMGSGSLAIKWEGSDKPSAWTVVDAEALSLQSDPRAYALSGKQYLMARSASIPDNEDPTNYQSSDWLISPEIKGGSLLTFWVNALSTDTEYFEIWYSTTGTELGTISKLRPDVCGDFKGRKPYSKSGSDTWEFISYQIPTNAKYVAIRHTSYDGLAIMIDDLSITPVELFEATADHYALYRSDNGGVFNKVADNILGTSFNDDTYNDTNANYHLVCVKEINGKMVEGPKSNNVFIQSSSVAAVNGETDIRGGAREIILVGFEGQNVEIYTTDGKVAYNTAVRAQQAHFGLEPGIYLVRVAGQQAKVIVK